MELEQWLKENNMKIKDLAELMGCSRTLIWKIKRGMSVCPEFAYKIHLITNGLISPEAIPRGKPSKLSTLPHKSI